MSLSLSIRHGHVPFMSVSDSLHVHIPVPVGVHVPVQVRVKCSCPCLCPCPYSCPFPCPCPYKMDMDLDTDIGADKDMNTGKIRTTTKVVEFNVITHQHESGPGQSETKILFTLILLWSVFSLRISQIMKVLLLYVWPKKILNIIPPPPHFGFHYLNHTPAAF